ncbi:hypothetical protein ACNFJ7_04900 [Sphingomonas sp. HT-1]|nr:MULTISPECIES: hypothetical protein [unclassified Sphingomonas]
MPRSTSRSIARPQPASPSEAVARLAVLASVFAWAGVVVELFLH